MYGKRQLMVLGPALLAALTLGPASISHASATPDPTPPAASAQQSKPTTDLAPPARDPRGGYWNGYRDGYRAAGQDCSRPRAKAGELPGLALRISDYDRGWLDGYDDGHDRFCR
ncbi:hypothetical protein OG884_07980 [Streptosporangium sp. NBC_01755]|uniref:hypothetical protein n=1 Tax=unclassified Streptosporangium TaxID=2632669 RepID=UPI002DD88CA1|nr:MULTISPECIES: hypothetical protein [unclassified Streptosporangium]WSA26728.1 hypothetical protein OIE13_02175 [Streptosporangium sp. NBC_01810]WSD01847.1 hypothetical protein OG884_07980 [Streptosporangium sp. NBC_01755]